MEVLFFTEFSKRKNSTKVPDDSTSVTKTVTLKSTTDKVNPTFFLKGTDDYVYCKAWGMYYFVHRTSYDIDGTQIIYCNIDVLATFKTQILNTNAYIIYSSTGYNRWIRDDRCPIVIKGSEYVHAASAITMDIGTGQAEPIFTATNNEIVVITTVSKEQGLVHWVTTEDTFKEMIMTLMDADDSIFASLANQFGGAIGSIVQVMRLPIHNLIANYVSEGPYDVYLGNYLVEDPQSPEPLGLKRLKQTRISARGSVGIPITYTDFRFTEPYCNAKLSLPFVGVVDISLSEIAPEGGFDWRMDLDLLTGAITWTVANSTSGTLVEPIASFSGQCGGLIPIASTQIANASSIVTGLANGGMLTGAALLAGKEGVALGTGISAVASAFYNSFHKSTSIVGSYSGNRSEFANTQVRLSVEKFATANEPSNLTELEGRPVCKVDTIGNYSGYIQTQKCNIDISSLDVFKDMINSLMDSGVYLE